MLGYKVADYVETCEADFQKRDSDSLAWIGFGLALILKIVKLMSEPWLQFFEGKIDAKTVLEKYKERGNNQDDLGKIFRSGLHRTSTSSLSLIPSFLSL